MGSIARVSSHCEGQTDSQLRACSLSRVTAIFRFCRILLGLTSSVWGFSAPRDLFCGFVGNLGALVSASCLGCSNDQLQAPCLPQVADIFFGNDAKNNFLICALGAAFLRLQVSETAGGSKSYIRSNGGSKCGQGTPKQARKSNIYPH